MSLSTTLVNAPAGLKVILFFAAWLIIWLPVAIPVAKKLPYRPFQPLKPEQKLPLLGSLYLIAPLIVWGVIAWEGSSWGDYGLFLSPDLFISLFLGLVLGIFGIFIVFALELACGWVTWRQENQQNLWSVVVPILGLGLWIGFTEELVFRGWLWSQLSQDYGLWIGAIVSSAIFALLHLVWERQETLPQLPGLWLMGMVLVLARIVDGGSLGLAWGLHAGWIWGLTCLDTAQLISYTGKGSVWMTGWFNQPLAGAAGVLCLLVTGLGLWLSL